MMRSPALILLAAGLAGPLAACTTTVDTAPPRSASEELLISKAAEQAADALKLEIPAGTKLFVDATNFDGTDSKYAIGTIRDRLARQGAVLVDKKPDAQTVVELRSGALSDRAARDFDRHSEPEPADPARRADFAPRSRALQTRRACRCRQIRRQRI
ncbi:MAG: hypothetical protein WDN69_15800 [Aliidongia sp.]